MICSKCGVPFYNCCDDTEHCPECRSQAQHERIRAAREKARGREGE